MKAKRDESSEIWSLVTGWAKSELRLQNYELWFKPIECRSVLDGQVVLSAPNKFIRDWFETHYSPSVLEMLEKTYNRTFTIAWSISEAKESESDAAAAAVPVERESKVVVPVDVAASRDANELLARYTFDTFVIGPSNQLAEAAANAVADNPASKYNPLFIYGGVGLGKTHLLHAIGHKIRARQPDWRIVYLKSETFMNEYINSVRNNRIEDFRNKHRSVPNILLMDDIQYLGGKERTQDEFFHTFNALFETHRQIVVTADKYPHEIPDLEERIRSRFQWGLIVDIQPPELETRIAIISKKAEYDGIVLPSDVAYYLASNIKSNVRELEGLLIRVAAFASLQERPITLDFARDTLKNFLGGPIINVSVEMIQREVAAFFEIKINDLKSTKRQQSIARPRQIAMYLARKYCKISYPELGLRFGGKDHTTVLSACRRVELLMQKDPKLRAVVQDLERRIIPL